MINTHYNSKAIIDAITQQGDADIALHSQRFFKTGAGEYGEGDIFLGVRVPVLRQAAKKFHSISLETVSELLASQLHEIRLLALIILVEQFKKASVEQQTLLYHFYLSKTERVNSWDLVDNSAHHIVGGYLADKDREILYVLSDSSSLWERRIAMMATIYFIRLNQFEDTLSLAEKMLSDKEDLIHKINGWMLREVGKRDLNVLRGFLNSHISRMPRTMLRYAIEKLEHSERQHYLSL